MKRGFFPLYLTNKTPLLTGGVCLFLLFGVPRPAEALVDLEAPVYRNQGYYAQQRKQWDAAIKNYQKAVAIDPFYATPHNDLGIIYEKLGELEKAERHYLQAISLDPWFLDPYANLALFYERTGKRDQAIQYWKKRIDYGHPNDPWTRKAVERLSLLAKEEIIVTYPPHPAQKPPSEPMDHPLVTEGREWKSWGEHPMGGTETGGEYEEYGAIPTELYYTIGPGDSLKISVWQHDDLKETLVVRPDGRISFPLVDDLYVSGLTPKQVDDELTQQLSKTVRDPVVTVNVTAFGSKAVYVLGEVRRPGRYSLDQPRTAMEMISEAGQWMDSGVLTSVMVVRRGWTEHPEVYRVNLVKVVQGGDPSSDMVLQDGDVIFIPRNFVTKLDNFLTFFSKHLFGSVGGVIGGRPVRIVEPVEIR